MALRALIVGSITFLRYKRDGIKTEGGKRKRWFDAAMGAQTLN